MRFVTRRANRQQDTNIGKLFFRNCLAGSTLKIAMSLKSDTAGSEASGAVPSSVRHGARVGGIFIPGEPVNQ